VVSEIRIYVEGGGNKADTKARFREGMSVFLGQLRSKARANAIRWNIIACGGRDQAYKRYVDSLQKYPSAFNVLLVDAEAAVTICDKPWQHLAGRDGWDNAGSSDDNCHLMVQMMEAWFIADPLSLANYYGQGFRPNCIPSTPNVETVPKAQLLTILAKATRNTTKGEYGKISHGCQLLQRIDPVVVRSKAPYCERLFATLKNKMA
jgi:hypothetical protein